jgi:hypothetical protein
MRKLEELLNLPDSREVLGQEPEEMPEIPEPDYRDIAEFDKIEIALPTVAGLGDASDREYDDLAQRATDAFDHLIDLGMNVEAKYSSRLFEVASSMLKNAIDAKSAKIDKKLKMIELQLKKQKLDSDRKISSDTADVNSYGVIVTDRNSLLEKLRNANENSKSS